MDVFLSTFEAIATIFIIGFIGFAVMLRRLVPRDALSAISPLFLEVALPALGFIKIVNSFDISQKYKVILMPLLWCVFTVIIFLLAHLFKYLSRKQWRAEFAMTLFFQNAIFIPLIILHRLYGADNPYIVDLFLFSILYSPFFFHYNHLFVKSNGLGIRWNKLYHPVVMSTLLAIIIVLLGLKSYVPVFMTNALSMVGGMAIPLLMVIVGGNIYLDFSATHKIYYGEVLKFILVKNFIFPAIALLVIWSLSLSHDLGVLILLQAATPPLMAVPIFAERLGRDRAIVNQYIIGSIIVSVISIPLFFFLFNLI